MKQMYVKGRGQALLGAGVQCVELVFSIKNILLVGIKGLDGCGFPSRSVSLQNVYPAKVILIFS